jgi:hypothetical protein
MPDPGRSWLCGGVRTACGRADATYSPRSDDRTRRTRAPVPRVDRWQEPRGLRTSRPASLARTLTSFARRSATLARTMARARKRAREARKDPRFRFASTPHGPTRTLVVVADVLTRGASVHAVAGDAVECASPWFLASSMTPLREEPASSRGALGFLVASVSDLARSVSVLAESAGPRTPHARVLGIPAAKAASPASANAPPAAASEPQILGVPGVHGGSPPLLLPDDECRE